MLEVYLCFRISIFYAQTLSGFYQGTEKWLLNKKAGALIRRDSANSVSQLLINFFCPIGIQKLIGNSRVDAKVQIQVLVRRLSHKIMRFSIEEPNFVGIFTFPGWLFPDNYSAKLNFLMKFSYTRPPANTRFISKYIHKCFNLKSKCYFLLFFFMLIIFSENYFSNTGRNLQFFCTCFFCTFSWFSF